MKYKRSKCPTPSHKQFHKRAAKARNGNNGCAVVLFLILGATIVGVSGVIQIFS